MLVSNDFFEIIKNPRLFLANPQKIYIGELYDVKNFKAVLNVGNISEITFDVYSKTVDGNTLYYDQILGKKLIEFKDVGWFQIEEALPTQNSDTPCEIKSVKCLSLENELVDKRLDLTDGVYGLCDFNNQEYSIMHLITRNTLWGIGHIDNSLLGKKRVFGDEDARKYNFLTTTVAKSYECVFIFDTYSRLINAYEVQNIGELTDTVIHASNVLKDYNQQSQASDIITKMRVKGGDGFDIREINPTSTNELVNLDYFLVPISQGGWMTDGLITAFNNYKNAYTSYIEQHSNNVNLLKAQLSSLTTLKTQLTDLKGRQLAQEEIQGSYTAQYKSTSAMSPDVYSRYLAAVNNIDACVTQIANKKREISNLESLIANTQSVLSQIGNNLNMANYLTQEQMNELSTFETEGDTYEDSSFVIMDTMTEEEILDMRIELMYNAANELSKASRPRVTTTTTINNLFTIVDNKDSIVSLEEWRSKFKLGNLISLKFRDDYFSTVRLISMTIDFNNLSDIEVVFSDKNRLDDHLSQLEELIGSAGKTSSVLSLAKYGYDKASKQTNEIREFMTNALNATTNAMHNNDRVEVEFGKYGIKNREWLENESRYSDYQSWWNNNTLLFSSDGFKTAKTGIGLFTTSDNQRFYGVIADVVVGEMVLTNALNVKNENNTISLDKNGATFTDCDITINKGVNSIRLNANEGISIYKGIDRQLYLDIDGNVVTSGKIVGGSININNRFTVDSNGNLVAVGGRFSGDITGSNISGSTLTSTGYIGGILYTTTIEGGHIVSDFISAKTISVDGMVNMGSHGINVYSSTSGGVYTSIDGNMINTPYIYTPSITCGLLNNSAPITAANKDLYTFKPSEHTHTGYASASHTQSSYTIYPTLTGAGNISLLGSPNAASTTWCEATFVSVSASDFRLKKNIRSLDELPIELYMELKPKLFEFKCDLYVKGNVMGLLAQQVESAFEKYGLNPYDYNLIEIVNTKSYTDEGLYVFDGKVHRINYNNFIAWGMHVLQKLYKMVVNG